MANTQSVRFSLTLLDELGTEASDTYYALVDPAGLVSDMVTAWNTLAQKLDAVVGGQIIRGAIDILPLPSAVSGPALKNAPIAGSRVEQTGIFNFSNNVTTHRWGGVAPSLRDSVITAGKINLTTGGPVDLFIQFLLTSGIAVLTWVTNNQQTLVALRDALISFRKRRKQLSRTSFEL